METAPGACAMNQNPPVPPHGGGGRPPPSPPPVKKKGGPPAGAREKKQPPAGPATGEIGHLGGQAAHSQTVILGAVCAIDEAAAAREREAGTRRIVWQR